MDDDKLAALLKRYVCPRCRKRYDDDDLLFINVGLGGTRELNLRCLRCKQRVRLQVPRQRQRVPQKPTPAVAKALVRREPVSDNDVQEMRRLLAGSHVSMEELLRRLEVEG